MDESNITQIEAKYKGIKGWLLLFVLVLLVFNPIAFFIYFVSSSFFKSIVSPDLSVFNLPGFEINVLNTVVYFSLVIFGIYAGIALWKIRANAVKIAQIFLIASLCFGLIQSFITPFLLPKEVVDFIGAVPFYLSLFYSITGFLIWFGYLKKSKRVAITYSLPIPKEEKLKIFNIKNLFIIFLLFIGVQVIYISILWPKIKKEQEKFFAPLFQTMEQGFTALENDIKEGELTDANDCINLGRRTQVLGAPTLEKNYGLGPYIAEICLFKMAEIKNDPLICDFIHKDYTGKYNWKDCVANATGYGEKIK